MTKSPLTVSSVMVCCVPVFVCVESASRHPLVLAPSMNTTPVIAPSSGAASQSTSNAIGVPVAAVVAVMYAGRVVEYGSVHDVFKNPLHPYTRGLFESMPVLGQSKHRLRAIPGNVPNPANFPAGCPFHPRCAHSAEQAKPAAAGDTVEVSLEGKPVRVMKRCVGEVPPLLEVAENHWAACPFAPGYAGGKSRLPDVSYRREPVGV